MAWFGDAKKGRIGTFFRTLLFAKGYWQLNGSSADNSGNGNNGADTAVDYGLGKFGRGANFNGSSSYISLAYSATLNPGTAGFTRGAWIKTTATVVTSIYTAQESGGTHLEIESLGINANGTISFSVRGSENVYYNFNSNAVVNDGKWHFVVGVSTGSSGSLYIYIDGKFDNSLAIGATTINFSTPTPHTIGAYNQAWVPWTGQYFNGQIEELIADSRVWSAQEISQYYKWAISNKKPLAFNIFSIVSFIAFTIVSQLSEFEKQTLIEGPSTLVASIISKIDTIIINEIKLFNIMSIFDKTDKLVSTIRNVILKIIRQEPKGEATIIKPSGRTKIDKAN